MYAQFVALQVLKTESLFKQNVINVRRFTEYSIILYKKFAMVKLNERSNFVLEPHVIVFIFITFYSISRRKTNRFS